MFFGKMKPQIAAFHGIEIVKESVPEFFAFNLNAIEYVK